jgi:tetratricopeptide (TPR) repeat protein
LVRLAAGTALDGLVQGLAAQADVARADALLVALGEDGIPAREIAYRRASLALTSAADLAPAVAGAAAILFDTEGSDERVDREWRVRGALLGAAAEIAAVTTEHTAEDAQHLMRARAQLDLARRTLAGLLAERIELLSSPARRARGNDEDRATYAHLDCLVDLWLAAAQLAAGGTPDDALLLSALRSMHVRQITAQAVAAESGARNDLGGFQPLLDDPLGPLRLVWSNRESRAWPPDRALGAWAGLGRALAGVSAAEMPGFEPASSLPAMRDPLADPERKRLLAEVLRASFDGVLGERSAEGDRARPDEDKLDRLLLNFRIIASDLQRLRDGDEAVLRRTRTPSNLALDLTVRYLEDGDAAEARALAERMKADLFKAGEAGGAGGAGVPEPLVARLEAAVGSAYMDESDPENAERSFRQAASRLEAYEQGLEARVAAEAGDPELRRSIDFALLSVRSQRADCLLSLAVNANVKKNDQEAALAWFEQAFELKQNDFMRVLLACYRARSGRAAEARAVLREVAPVPSLYYNLACTHALLGDLDFAADYLARELGENHASERSRARQRQWARGDPDLSALHGHPRFERLVGP